MSDCYTPKTKAILAYPIISSVLLISAQTWSQLSITNCNTGINLAAPGASPSDPVGSLYLMDSMFTNTPTMIYTYPWLGVEEGTTVISLDNVVSSVLQSLFVNATLL